METARTGEAMVIMEAEAGMSVAVSVIAGSPPISSPDDSKDRYVNHKLFFNSLHVSTSNKVSVTFPFL